MEFKSQFKGDINKIVDDFAKGVNQASDIVLQKTALGAQTLIVKAYNSQVYQGPLGAFGYPRNRNQALAQSVSPPEKIQGGYEIYPTQQHAVFVEFGTGIYSTAGPKAPIRPRRAKMLAFPVWQLPSNALSFLPREQVQGPLPSGALGLVFAKQVKGMKPRPIWYNPAILNGIDRIFDLEAKKAFE